MKAFARAFVRVLPYIIMLLVSAAIIGFFVAMAIIFGGYE